jgi:uncharacterized protein
MILGGLFFIVALFYASVGFGGGSSYLALLVLWDLPYAVIPAIALICNIVVVAGNSFHYVRAGYLNKRLLLPLVMASIPMSYLGGRLEIEKNVFVLILFLSLLMTGIRLLIQHRSYEDDIGAYKPIPGWLAAITGGTLGLLAGITGIGGGIFLSPVLYNLRAGSPKQIACITSLFILLNSISGLAGQLQKHGFSETTTQYWYLPALAFLGGQAGNLLMLRFIPARIAALLTALLVLFVAIHLGLKSWGG